MTIKRILLTITGIILPLLSLMPQEQNDAFTIYLIRHAEKDDRVANARDPELSEAGRLRAANLAHIFSETGLKHIYTTNYARTLSTAAPVADTKGLVPEIYNAQNLASFRDMLLSRREDALVVGHSNTTSVLAGLLAGKELPPMADTVYSRIYIVVISGNNAILNVLNQGMVTTILPQKPPFSASGKADSKINASQLYTDFGGKSNDGDHPLTHKGLQLF